MKRCRSPLHVAFSHFTFIVCISHAFAQPQQSPPGQAAREWTTVEELWYSMDIAGGKAGWMTSHIQTNGEVFRTTTQTWMKLNRVGSPIEIEFSSTFTETADGKPIFAESVQTMAKQPVKTNWKFEDDHIAQTTYQSGRDMHARLPLPNEEWLPPMAVHRYVEERRKAGAQELSYRTIDPQNGFTVIPVSSKRIGEESFEHEGRTIPVSVWNTTTTVGMAKVESVERHNADGKVVHSETPIAGMKVIVRLTTKESAQGDIPGFAPELMMPTLIKPDKPIDNARKAVKATLRVKLKDGDAPSLPAAGSQRVEIDDQSKSAILTIDVNASSQATSEELADKSYLAASPLINSDDELIQKLTKRAAKRVEEERVESPRADDPNRRAEALRRLVNKHITRKGMATAFASASETAKTREGDCSEHGVLLCALLRADGIPARVATGLIYVDAFAGQSGVFGWHMWTQALIDGQWVDFDATLPKRYDATHILTAVSSMDETSGIGDLASILHLMGNMDIEVVEVEYE